MKLLRKRKNIMTIKTKLTWNVIIAIVLVGVVTATSIIGMGFVKSKLFYLTEQSTPYQVRTLELQRAIQGTTAGLVKVSAAMNIEEYKTHRAEVEKSLSEVKNTQDLLESLSALNAAIEAARAVEQGRGFVVVADMIQRIAVATEEQSSASEEVSHNMKNIAVITRELGNSIVEIKRAAGDLSRLATELNSMAGWVKV